MPHQFKIGGDSVGTIGFGAMGMSAFYGNRVSEEESLKVVHRAVELGCVMIDTADIYGTNAMGENEQLLAKALKDTSFRQKVFLATKFGNYRHADGTREIRGKPEYVREACETSLKHLGIDQIDLYYQHRVDRTMPIEETFEELKKLQQEGKIKHIGMSEATSEEIRKASKVVKIDALQIEFSPWTPEILTNGIMDTCKELGITVVAYSPLGRGFLTGQIKSPEDLEEGDFRKNNERFQGEAFKTNLKIVDELKKLADKKGCTPSQLCLAWTVAHGTIPIPGTKKMHYLEENMKAADITFTADELKDIDSVVEKLEVVGGRYPQNFAAASAF